MSYGQNDAPAAWYKVFNEEVLRAGFERSKFDKCLYWMKENGKLVGALGAHVDDTATGGSGSKYTKALEYLRQKVSLQEVAYGCRRVLRCPLPARSIIHVHQDVPESLLPMPLRPAHLPQNRKANRHAKLDAKEINVLQGINGSLNWLSTQGRPDRAAQTSISQHSFPEPTVHHLLEANNVIRRAKQFSDLDVTFESIPVDQLQFMLPFRRCLGKHRCPHTSWVSNWIHYCRSRCRP